MLRGWTPRGRRDLIEELHTLTRHAEVLASQERASGQGRRAETIFGFLVRARPVLAAIQEGGGSKLSRRELTTLHSLAVRQVARAEDEIRSRSATNDARRQGQELA